MVRWAARWQTPGKQGEIARAAEDWPSGARGYLMRKNRRNPSAWVGALGVLALAFVGMAVPVSSRAAGYKGASWCGGGPCHNDKYAAWKQSPHATMLRTPEEALAAGLPAPDGREWTDVWLVIGGQKRTRYLSSDGYTLGKVSNSVPGQPWQPIDYFNRTQEFVLGPPAESPSAYSCGSCHTTGYDAATSTPGKPGVVGSWALRGIQCERCHGGPGAMVVNRSTDLCAGCHKKTDSVANQDAGKIPTTTDPTSGRTYFDPGAQYNEFMLSKHGQSSQFADGCVTCHDPHKSARDGVTTSCQSCHKDKDNDKSAVYTSRFFADKGVTCVSCHMAAPGKEGAVESAYKGDTRSHVFAINTDPSAAQFYPVGTTTYANPYLGLGFACLQCHETRDVQWAAAYAEGIHSDPDGDGLSTFDERVLYRTDPTDPDTDGDLFADKTETEAGTDPLNPSEFPTPVGKFHYPVEPPVHPAVVLDDLPPVE